MSVDFREARDSVILSFEDEKFIGFICVKEADDKAFQITMIYILCSFLHLVHKLLSQMRRMIIMENHRSFVPDSRACLIIVRK